MVIQVHCVAHRLALASGRAADTVNLFKNYQSTVNAVYLAITFSTLLPGHPTCDTCRMSLMTTASLYSRHSAPAGSLFVVLLMHCAKVMFHSSQP